MSYLDDGYQTLISFTSNPAVKLKEKSVTPPGIDGGDLIDTTTMRNTTWRTADGRALKTLTESSFVAAYDPVVYNELNAMINVNQEIEITFPDGSKLKFWGIMRVFQPNELTEGEQPTANVTISPTNKNAAGVETGPTYTPAP